MKAKIYFGSIYEIPSNSKIAVGVEKALRNGSGGKSVSNTYFKGN